MAFTLEELLPTDQQLSTVQLHDTVQHAIELMYRNSFNQLPVVDKDGKTSLKLIVTFESILQAVQSFETKTELLQVRDVARAVQTYPADSDLLATLSDIQWDNFALIVDDQNVLTGIVTTADTTAFFQDYAQDLMQIEGIESRMKEAIKALYSGDDAGLGSAITVITDRAADTRRKLPGAIKAYLDAVGIKVVVPDNADALSELERRLGLPKPGKEFDRLTFDEIAEVLLQHPRTPAYVGARNINELRVMLQKVRDARNKLAHFRGEPTAAERRNIQFASDWLEKNLPTPSPESASLTSEAPAPQISTSDPGEEDYDGPKGSYAPLAAHLRENTKGWNTITMSFEGIEHILGKALPASAFKYRAWWSNDPTKPQSAAWLDEGWRTTAINMTERRLSFARTDDREQSYIKFFANLNKRLEEEDKFPLRNISPQGQSWIVLASFDHDSESINASFTRRRELRIELYIDSGDKADNKSRFERLLARRIALEEAFGEPLQWERLENKRACRIAVYTKATILRDSENTTLLEWAAKKAVDFNRVFGPKSPA